MNDVDAVTSIRALTSGEGLFLVEEATRDYAALDPLVLSARLRRHYPPELVSTALTQARLRHRATGKFPASDALQMFFTVDGYEQATHTTVAQYRARRIGDALGDSDRQRPGVVDLCCGIGGDMIALCRVGLDVTGVDADPLTAEVARLNLDALGLSAHARVRTADATTVRRDVFAAAVCDPARRADGARVFDPAAYQPPWPFVTEVLSGHACVKVAPGIPHELVPAGVEAEWISVHGEVKEAALWSGPLASTHGRRATLLTETTVATMTSADDPGEAPVRAPGRFLYEPDGAVIRAGLVTAVLPMVDGWLTDPQIAYISSDRRHETPFARGYEIRDVLPYNLKVVRGYVRENGLGTLTIKKRGVDITPETLRRTLRPRGSAAATLIVTRLAGSAAVLVADPLQ